MISSRGIERLLEKIKEIEKKIRENDRAGGESYHQGGDGYHANHDFNEANLARARMLNDISGMKEIVSDHVLIDDLPFDGTVAPGSAVKILYEGEDEVEEFAILGRPESDPENGVISYEAELAIALFGKREGETIIFRKCNVAIKGVSKWTPATS